MEAHIPTIGPVRGTEVTAGVRITEQEYEAMGTLAHSYLDSMAVVIERCGGPYEAFIEDVVTPVKKFVERELECDFIDADIEANRRDEDMAPEHPGG